MGGCQSVFGPLNVYSIKDPKRDHNFDSHPYDLRDIPSFQVSWKLWAAASKLPRGSRNLSPPGPPKESPWAFLGSQSPRFWRALELSGPSG